MSATLSVLHVLMAGGPAGVGGVGGVGGAGRLILPGAEGLPPLDPLLLDFWSSFPCPPPWNRALLFRVNWTACVGQTLGRRLQWLLADRCNIPHDVLDLDLDIDLDLLPLPGDIPGVGRGDESGMEEAGEEEEEGGGELEVPAECDVSCVAMIALACLVFSLLLAVLVFCICRNRSKASSPSHQSSLSAYQDNAKYYSCHYASAPILPRPLETRLCGSHAETRVMKNHHHNHHHHHHHPHQPPSPYHQHSPFHHHHNQHHHHHPKHHQHYEQHPLVSPQHNSSTKNRSTGYVHSQAHFNPILTHSTGDSPSSTLKPEKSPEPSHKRGEAGSSGLEGAASGYISSSSASQTYSDRSHTYESIGDVHCSGSVSSGMDKVTAGMGFRLYAQGHPSRRSSVGRKDSVMCETFSAQKLDRCFDVDVGTLVGCHEAQNLPVRRFRPVRNGDESAVGSSGGGEVEESPYAGRPQSTLSSGSRRRLSSSSHQSDCSVGGGYADGGGSKRRRRRRSIPALHPNYFDSPESSSAASETYTS